MRRREFLKGLVGSAIALTFKPLPETSFVNQLVELRIKKRLDLNTVGRVLHQIYMPAIREQIFNDRYILYALSGSQ